MKKRIALAAKILVDDTGRKAIEDTDSGLRITMVASVPSPDRSDEVIPTKAWRWSEDPLPKLHWGHKTGDPENVIGKLTRVWKDGERLMIEAEIADKVPGHTKAHLVAGLVRNGDVDQGSVGFLPHAWTEKNGRKVVGKEYYTGPRAGRTYDDVELFEFSLTTIPDQSKSILLAFRSLALEDEASVDGPPKPDDDAPEIPAGGKPEQSPEAKKEVEPSWLDRILGTEPQAPAGAALSRAEKDRLAEVRVHAVALKEAIDRALSAERADEEEAARAATNAQGGA